MTYGKRTLQILGSIVAILLMVSVAQATTVQITTPFTGNDSANWGNYGVGLGASVTNGSTLTTSGNTITFTSGFSDGGPGQVWVENTISGPDTFNGGFTNGEYLVNTNDTQAPSTPDTLTITFTNAISEFGIYVEEFDYTNSFSSTITSNDGSGTFTVGPASGAPEFLGIEDSGDNANITSITLSTSGPEAGYFLIGTAAFNDGNITVPPPPPPPTPEPASLLMVGGGLAGLAWKLRKRVRA